MAEKSNLLSPTSKNAYVFLNEQHNEAKYLNLNVSYQFRLQNKEKCMFSTVQENQGIS